MCVLLESESLTKVQSDCKHLRDNDEAKNMIYYNIYHPLCYCEDYYKKVYTSE